MINVKKNLPANVLGYAIIGEMTEDDYRELRPLIRDYSHRLSGGVNLLIDATVATGLGDRPFWEKAAREWASAGSVQRVALVGEPLWTKPFAKLSSMLALGDESAAFLPKERDRAVAWLTGVLELT